jgi:hypothetical protein
MWTRAAGTARKTPSNPNIAVVASIKNKISTGCNCISLPSTPGTRTFRRRAETNFPEGVFAVLLLVFVLANPRPLVAAYLALAPDRYREQAHRTLARLMGQMTAWARGVAINGVITGVSIGALLWLIGVQPAPIFGVFAFLREFVPTVGAFLVSIPILLVALSMGATKFWLALAVIVLVYQIELNDPPCAVIAQRSVLVFVIGLFHGMPIFVLLAWNDKKT